MDHTFPWVARRPDVTDVPEGTALLDTVVGRRGRRYPCPTVSAVDHHLAGLRDRITRAARFVDMVAEFREDVDLLLDRRMWLSLTAATDGNAEDQLVPLPPHWRRRAG